MKMRKNWLIALTCAILVCLCMTTLVGSVQSAEAVKLGYLDFGSAENWTFHESSSGITVDSEANAFTIPNSGYLGTENVAYGNYRQTGYRTEFDLSGIAAEGGDPWVQFVLRMDGSGWFDQYQTEGYRVKLYRSVFYLIRNVVTEGGNSDLNLVTPLLYSQIGINTENFFDGTVRHIEWAVFNEDRGVHLTMKIDGKTAFDVNTKDITKKIVFTGSGWGEAPMTDAERAPITSGYYQINTNGAGGIFSSVKDDVASLKYVDFGDESNWFHYKDNSGITFDKKNNSFTIPQHGYVTGNNQQNLMYGNFAEKNYSTEFTYTGDPNTTDPVGNGNSLKFVLRMFAQDNRQWFMGGGFNGYYLSLEAGSLILFQKFQGTDYYLGYSSLNLQDGAPHALRISVYDTVGGNVRILVNVDGNKVFDYNSFRLGETTTAAGQPVPEDLRLPMCGEGFLQIATWNCGGSVAGKSVPLQTLDFTAEDTWFYYGDSKIVRNNLDNSLTIPDTGYLGTQNLMMGKNKVTNYSMRFTFSATENAEAQGDKWMNWILRFNGTAHTDWFGQGGYDGYFVNFSGGAVYLKRGDAILAVKAFTELNLSGAGFFDGKDREVELSVSNTPDNANVVILMNLDGKSVFHYNSYSGTKIEFDGSNWKTVPLEEKYAKPVLDGYYQIGTNFVGARFVGYSELPFNPQGDIYEDWIDNRKPDLTKLEVTDPGLIKNPFEVPGVSVRNGVLSVSMSSGNWNGFVIGGADLTNYKTEFNFVSAGKISDSRVRIGVRAKNGQDRPLGIAPGGELRGYWLDLSKDGFNLCKNNGFYLAFSRPSGLDLFDGKPHRFEIQVYNNTDGGVVINVAIDGKSALHYVDDGTLATDAVGQAIPEDQRSALTGDGQMSLWLNNDNAFALVGRGIIVEDWYFANSGNWFAADSSAVLTDGKFTFDQRLGWSDIYTTDKLQNASFTVNLKLSAVSSGYAALFGLRYQTNSPAGNLLSKNFDTKSGYVLAVKVDRVSILKNGHEIAFAEVQLCDGNVHELTVVIQNVGNCVLVRADVDGKVVVSALDSNNPILMKGFFAAAFFGTAELTGNHRGQQQPYRVLFVGNSITSHAPSLDVGWEYDWGMAVDDPEKDYVHLTMAGIRKIHPDAQFKIVNVSDFERGYKDYDLAANLTDYREFNADLIILRIGENVPESMLKVMPITGYLMSLIDYLDLDANAKIILTTSFWKNDLYDEEIYALAQLKNYPVICLGDLGQNRENLAYGGNWTNEFVCMHPGETGMVRIAERILASAEDILSGGTGNYTLTETDGATGVRVRYNLAAASDPSVKLLTSGTDYEAARAFNSKLKLLGLYSISCAKQTAGVSWFIPRSTRFYQADISAYSVKDGILTQLEPELTAEWYRFDLVESAKIAVFFSFDFAEMIADGSISLDELQYFLYDFDGEKTVVLDLGTRSSITFAAECITALDTAKKDWIFRFTGGCEMKVPYAVLEVAGQTTEVLTFEVSKLADSDRKLPVISDAFAGRNEKLLTDQIYFISLRRGGTNLSLALPVEVTLGNAISLAERRTLTALSLNVKGLTVPVASELVSFSDFSQESGKLVLHVNDFRYYAFAYTEKAVEPDPGDGDKNNNGCRAASSSSARRGIVLALFVVVLPLLTRRKR